MHRYQATKAAARVAAVMILSAMTAACTVALVPPYNETIHKGAQALEDDFVRFAARMQGLAGTPEGFYARHKDTYVDFAARLAVLRQRSATEPRGVPCRRALEASRSAARSSSLAARASESAAARLTDPALAEASCVTILVSIAQDQVERLRSQHELRCSPSARAELCGTLFGSAPIAGIFSAGTGAGFNNSPLVSAVAISLDELVGAEEDLKPAPRS